MNGTLTFFDTSAGAFAQQIAALRRRGIEGRAIMAFELSDNLRAITESGIRHRHPEYDEAKIRLALIRLTAGKTVYRLLFPGDTLAP